MSTDHSHSPHSDLRAWITDLRRNDPRATLKESLDELDRRALDNAVGWAAEHARRYVATDGSDDGWNGPRPILLLYTTGRRSGQVRRNPLLCFEHGDRRFLMGSRGGDDTHPAWYLNLAADPRVHVRYLADVYEATARTVGDTERAELWPLVVERFPMFGDYQRSTERRIPLVELTPVDDRTA